MENSDEVSEKEFWKKIWSQFRVPAVLVIIAGICLIIGAILVLFWFIRVTPLGNYGTATIGQWRMHWVVGFIIMLILFELLFVGVPAGLFFGLGGYIWWHSLTPEKKQFFKDREKKESHRKRDYGGGGGFGFFMFIFYCIYLAFDGHYNVPFGNEPYTYWIYAWFLTVMWLLIYIGVPAAIILLIVYFAYWRKKRTPE
ncbi:MAG: hypothetical protein ACFFCV_09325 [Promethearchaeota archaeon]